MMQGLDLFATPERLPMPDADVVYYPNFFSPDDSCAYLEELEVATTWNQTEISIWGKRVQQPRLIAWYGDEGKSYKYSGVRMQPLPWTSTLRALREAVQRQVGSTFNSVLLNLYRSERDSMGWHSDDEPELGARPLIASVSLGDTRVFQFRHKGRQELGTIKLPLASGSLLTMAGDTQKFWQHSIQKEPRRCGKRINLTFRNIL